MPKFRKITRKIRRIDQITRGLLKLFGISWHRDSNEDEFFYESNRELEVLNRVCAKFQWIEELEMRSNWGKIMKIAKLKWRIRINRRPYIFDTHIHRNWDSAQQQFLESQGRPLIKSCEGNFSISIFAGYVFGSQSFLQLGTWTWGSFSIFSFDSSQNDVVDCDKKIHQKVSM